MTICNNFVLFLDSFKINAYFCNISFNDVPLFYLTKRNKRLKNREINKEKYKPKKRDNKKYKTYCL